MYRNLRTEPLRQLAYLLLIITLTEAGIMLLLGAIPINIPFYLQSFIDVLILVCVVGPLLYSRIILPLLKEIAERRAAESSLVASELRYSLVTDNLLDVVFALDKESNFTFLTPSAEAVFGYPSSEMLGTNLHRYLTVESNELAARFVADAFTEQQFSSKAVIVYSGEFQMICKEGSLKWVEVKESLIFSSGELSRIVGVARDIDARKAAETELNDAYALLDKTISSLNEAVFIVSATNRSITRVNKTAEEMFGYSAVELIGAQTSILHLDNNSYERFEENISTAHSGSGYLETAFHMKRKDGSTFDSESLLKQINNELGLCIGHVFVVRDITARLQIEDDLSMLVQEVESRKKFVESIIANLQSGIIVIDLDFRINMVNRYVSQLCGLPSECLLGKSLADISPELHERVLSLKLSDEFLAKFLDYQKVIGYSLFNLTDTDGKFVGYIINFKDLTEITKIRKELRLKERLSSIGEVVARVAHEMRNPLFGMTAAAQILEMELALSPSQKELMDSLLNESRRLNNLVEELLDTTRETRINKKRISLVDVLNESVRAVDAMFQKKNVSLQKIYGADVWIYGDFEKLEQVIINLVKNAMEASVEGESVNLEIISVDSHVSVIVEDKGEGIPSENIDRIFEVFYTTKKKGTGMGLSISRGIVEAHGGSLIAEHNPEGGARFVIQFPLGDSPA